MALSIGSGNSFSDTWEVLLLFLIPIGGGIPAGVLKARSFHIEWPEMMGLYLISDVILACLFEPLALLIISASKRFQSLVRLTAVFKELIKKTTAPFGSRLGPLALIAVAFGADPMTGRAATIASGHGFITGWALAITGDMLYFCLLMVSTLWLNNILGDGTLTTIIIMLVMMFGPSVVRYFWKKR